MTGNILRWFTCPQTVIHPSTNPETYGRASNSCWSQVRRPNHYTTKPRLNPSHARWYSRDGRLSWPSCLVTYRDDLLAHRWSPIQVL